MATTNALIVVTVYQFQTREGEALPHVYRTREAIAAKGGRVVEASARDVPAYEVINYGLWKPERNPVT